MWGLMMKLVRGVLLVPADLSRECLGSNPTLKEGPRL